VQVLSHRGYWKTASEKNQEVAFRRSFELGFGTETDIRDLAGELVISHDPPLGGEISADRLFQIYIEYDRTLPLALNIKADGLHSRLQALLAKYEISSYFVFDMSVPDAKLYVEQNFKAFTRQSELETSLSLYEQSVGVWLDCFYSDWIDEATIQSHLQNGKQVCIVSPDLHKREYGVYWKQLSEMSIVGNPQLMICTDYPEEASAVFSNL
jgi:hypothetical protein